MNENDSSPTPFYEPHETGPPPIDSEHVAAEPEDFVTHDPKAAQLFQRVREQIKRVFLGQDVVIDQILAAFVAGGHVLLEGKPGLGKTHLVLALSRTFGGNFGRIQFTPDLMPSDVSGHTLFDMRSQTFHVRQGPVFTNLLLADEINRAPAKTQAALLEVMQERQVTIDGKTLPVDPPFMTLATQNPIEQEGTYPLPEAQLDRFLMKILIDYPNLEDEESIVSQASSGASGSGIRVDDVEVVCSSADIIAAQEEAAAVQAVPEVIRYALNIVRATRESPGISLGAGTRGAISLVRVAKANALLDGRNFITPDDVKSAVFPVLRHRVMLAPELAISGQQVDDTLLSVVRSVEAPRQ